MRRARQTTPPEVARRLELDVSYASRSPWAPSARLLSQWAEAALAPLAGPHVLSVRIVGVRSNSLTGVVDDLEAAAQ